MCFDAASRFSYSLCTGAGGTQLDPVTASAGSGELFFYEDLVITNQFHSRDAKALTPLALIRLNRSGFLTLIHRHPTLVVELIAQQHTRLRQQRTDARHFY